HKVSICPAVRKLDEECTMLLQTLTMKQLEVVQEMINEHFNDGLNANQVPEALKLTLELVEVIIKKESKAKEIVHMPSYKEEEKLDKVETKIKKIHTPYLKSTAHEITFNYSLLCPVRTQKNEPKRKIPVSFEDFKSIDYQLANNNPICCNRNKVGIKVNNYKALIHAELDEEPCHKKIVSGQNNSYLNEPEMYLMNTKPNNNDDDNETWYPCNNKIPEEWLGSINHKELTKAELKAMKSLDKSDEPDNYKEADEKIKFTNDTKKNSKYLAFTGYQKSTRESLMERILNFSQNDTKIKKDHHPIIIPMYTTLRKRQSSVLIQIQRKSSDE
ncbi:5031_t:CDS:2, partial [Dentiscutata heterogama]